VGGRICAAHLSSIDIQVEAFAGLTLDHHTQAGVHRRHAFEEPRVGSAGVCVLRLRLLGFESSVELARDALFVELLRVAHFDLLLS
jgi:hypothetical protein